MASVASKRNRDEEDDMIPKSLSERLNQGSVKTKRTTIIDQHDALGQKKLAGCSTDVQSVSKRLKQGGK
jgi:hypothetical protein